MRPRVAPSCIICDRPVVVEKCVMCGTCLEAYDKFLRRRPFGATTTELMIWAARRSRKFARAEQQR